MAFRGCHNVTLFSVSACDSKHHHQTCTYTAITIHTVRCCKINKYGNKHSLYICRCVEDEQRHLSLGVASFISRVLGTIPGPLITGALFDSACLLRNEQQQQCGLLGNCLVYDNFALSVRIVALVISGLSLSALFSFLTWISYPKPKQQTKGSSSVDDMKRCKANEALRRHSFDYHNEEVQTKRSPCKETSVWLS